jgi:predicted kinase
MVRWRRRTYERLAECAENCLRAGLNSIVDAAFLDPAERALFHALARRLDARFAIVACRADAATLAARVTNRARTRRDASDATRSVLDAQLRELQPFGAAELPWVIPIVSNDPDAVQRVAAAIRRRAREVGRMTPKSR